MHYTPDTRGLVTCFSTGSRLDNAKRLRPDLFERNNPMSSNGKV